MEPSRDLYRLNLAVLTRRDPRFVKEVIEGTPLTGELEVLESRRGEATMRLDGVFLHSSVDPRKEARRMAGRSRERAPEELRDATVLLGLGLGYHLEALLESGREPIIVVEPDPSVLVTAMHYRDLRPALGEARTTLSVGRDASGLIDLLNALEIRYPVTLSSPAVRNVNERYYREVEEALLAFRQRNEINANTLSRFGKLWVRNLLVNLRLLASSPGLGVLENAFEGIPALLLAAGPTFDELAPYLGSLRERCLLVAVDTALPLLHRLGVEPDISVVVDPQYWNSRHLDQLLVTAGLAVAEPSTHPRVLRHLRLPTLFGGSLFPLGRFVESMLPNRMRLGAGGSVATSAWDVARIAGAREIYTIGLDLGFPGLKTHAEGSFFEERGHILSDRLSGIEEYTYRYLRGGEPFIAEATSGEPLLSDRRMQIYRWWFETQDRLHQDVATFTLSPSSLSIEGRHYVPPESLKTLPSRRAEIDRTIKRVRELASNLRSNAEQRLAALREATGVLEEEIRRVAGIAAEGSRICEKLEGRLREAGDLTGEDLAGLDRIDASIASAPHRDVLGFLMQEVDREARRQSRATSRREQLEENIRRSRSIYEQLEQAASYHETLFAKLLRSPADT
ncbi:MAG: motility associated factor glycosyltransferase family protein [Alkalispirochaetaceae bacterium]